MSSTAEPGFSPGEALLFTALENGFPTKRGVEFISISNGGTSALVKWAGQSLNVQLDQLARIEPPQPPATIGKWFTVPKAPIAPTEEQLVERI
jgi:hypothetical protein